MRRPALLWTLAAVGGLVLVAGMTLAASRLSSQTVGLSSEPLQAGGSLAPADATRTPSPTAKPRGAKQRKRARPKPPAPTAIPTPRAVVTAAPAPPAPVATVDDHGGHGSDDPPGDDHGGHGSDD
jgi:hypothetical protein